MSCSVRRGRTKQHPCLGGECVEQTGSLVGDINCCGRSPQRSSSGGSVESMVTGPVSPGEPAAYMPDEVSPPATRGSAHDSNAAGASERGSRLYRKRRATTSIRNAHVRACLLSGISLWRRVRRKSRTGFAAFASDATIGFDWDESQFKTPTGGLERTILLAARNGVPVEPVYGWCVTVRHSCHHTKRIR